MKKAMTFGLIIVMTAMMMTGCGFSNDADTNTVFVAKNGKITDITIEDFDKDYYDEEELKTYIDDAVNSYKEDGGAGTVKMKKFTVQDKSAKLTMEYGDYEAYAAFNEAEFFTGTVVQAQAAGYDFDSAFLTAEQAVEGNTEVVVESVAAESVAAESVTEDDTESVAEEGTESLQESSKETVGISTNAGVSSAEATKEADYKVVILKQNTNVKVKGTIVYVSDNVTVSDKNLATVTGEGEDSADARLAYIIYK